MKDKREIPLERGEMLIRRNVPYCDWMECTESQWEKKAELSQRNGQMGEALKYADYANCVALYEAGFTVKEIQGRFNNV